MLRQLANSVAVALFPPRCGVCGRALAAFPAHGMCEACEEVLEPNAGRRCGVCDLPGADPCRSCALEAPPFARLRAPWIYGGGLAELVAAAKFHGREDLAAALGRLLCADSAVLEAARACEAIVPVPLGSRRRRQRGYNQSAILARALGRAAGRPVLHALRRSRETPPQSELPLAARRANLAGAFAATRPVPQTILLVDDVVTSGETARQSCSALLAAGAQRIVVAAVARAAHVTDC